ncbi:MAG: DUF2807 domain-containing protein [Bacteroidia bacterium]
MNKTISINISGLVFNIEEQAFEKLKKYLDSIKTYFKNEEGGSDIIADIEARIAELFQEKLNEDKTVVTEIDVDSIISNLGQPQEMMEEEDLESEPRQEQNQQQEYRQYEKKIYRDADEKVIGGVCAGLGHYLGLDALWVRLIFILITFLLPGTGVIIYGILWAIVPEALTTTEKLKMKGKPVNVSNIEESIKKGFKNIGDDLNEFVNDPENKKRIQKGTNKITEVIQMIVSAIGTLIKIVAKIIAISFIVIAVSIIIGLSIAFFSSVSIFGFVFNDLVSVVFPGPWHASLLLITILLVVAIPLVVSLIRGFQLLLKQGSIPKPILITTFVVWLVSVVGLITQVGMFMVEIRSEATVENEIKLNNPQRSRYYIETIKTNSTNGATRHYGYDHWSDDNFYFQDKMFFYKNVNFKVEKSNDGDFHLIKQVFSKGQNYNDAVKNAQAVEYMFNQDDSIIYLNPFVGLNEKPLRFQKINLILQVPAEKEIMFLNYTYDIDNYAYVFHDYPNKVLKMTDTGLEYAAGVERSQVEDGMLKYQYSGFDEVIIESEEPIRAQIIEGSEYKVLISEELANKKKLEFRTHHKEFTIEIDETNEKMNDVPVHIIIEVPSLREATCAGIGDYVIETEKSSGIIEVNCIGATKGTFVGHLDVLEVNVAGVSSMALKGSVEKLNCDIAGSSSLNSLEMIAEKAELDLAGVCSADVYVTDYLDIDAGGSSIVKYKGEPNIQRRTSGVAIIEKID